MSNSGDPKKKKTVATSYDNNFGPISPDDIARLTPEQARENIKNIEKLHGTGRVLESFDLSANDDYLQGWENPHAIYGGLDTTASDPFEELRAIRQGWGSKALSGTARVGTKVASEILKMPGYIGGLAGGLTGEAIDAVTGKNEYNFTEQAFNNGWVKAIEQVNQNINNEALPVYVKKAVKEGNLWDNVSSIDFWATEGADGIGFMASMLVPGAVLKSLGLGSKMMNATSKLAAWSGESSRLASVARGIEKLGLNAQKFDVFNATMANTYLEAAAESGMAMDSFEKEHKGEFLDNMIAQGMTQEQAEEAFTKQKALLGRNMFMGNAMLLLGPNALQSSMLFGKGASKLINSYTTKEAIKSGLKRVGTATLSEGFVEEASQTTMENYFKGKAGKNKLKGDSLLSLEDFDPKGLKDAYLNTLASTEGQKAIFLGGILGSTMSVYQGRKEDVRNRRATEHVNSLTERYDSTLRSIVETDNYKRDENGDIIYDYNNNPIVDKNAVIEKFRTIDALSNRFDEYDKALQEGDEETLEKARNKTIQDVILPFVRQGEIGMEALSQYYDKMLESEDVQSSESKDEIIKRKDEVMNIAQDVSKKYENYVNFATSKFDLSVPTENKEQLQRLNDLKKDYFNRLASSYAMAETERNQVKDKLKEVSKEIAYLEDINKVDNPTTVESLLSDEQTISPEENKNNLYNKNESYKDLVDRKKRLEDKFKEVEKEIADNYFDNSKIKDDFLTKIQDNIVDTSEVVEDVTDQTEEEDFEENEINLEDLGLNEDTIEKESKFEQPEITDEDKLNDALEVNELDDTIDSLKLQLQDQTITTREELNQAIDELPIDNNIKQAIKISLRDEYNSLPTEEELDAKEIAVRTELMGLNEEELEKSDVAEDLPIDEVYNEDVVEEDISLNENSEIKGHMLMSLTKTFEPVFKSLKDFIKYEKEPRVKLDDEVTFNVGDLEFITNSTIKNIFDKIKKGGKLTKSELQFLKDHKEELYNDLPISVTLSDGKKSATSFLKALGSRTGTSKAIFEKEELPLRKNIIDKLFDNNFNFNKFKGSVRYQGKGKLNLDNLSSTNNVLELSVFKDMTKAEKIKYIQENSYIVNRNRELISTFTNQPTSESFNHTLKALHPGDMFLVVTRPNGERFPLKLNNNRLTREKAIATIKVLSLWSNLVKENLVIKGKFETFIKENIGEDAQHLQSEINFVKNLKVSNIEKFKQLLNLVIHTQNNNEVSKFFLDNKGNLVLGSLLQKVNDDLKEEGAVTYESRLEDIGFVGFNYTALENLHSDNLNQNEIDAREHLINFLIHKKYNVQADFSNPKYVSHVLGLNNNEPLVSTNVVVGKDMFEGYSNIFINNEVVDKTIKTPSQDITEIEKTIVPTKPFQGYPAPEVSNEVTINDILALEKPQNVSNIEDKKADIELSTLYDKLDKLAEIFIKNGKSQNEADTLAIESLTEDERQLLRDAYKNNLEKIRNSQEISVSLQDKSQEIINKGLDMDSLTDLQKKEFNKLALKLVDKSIVQEVLKLKSIDDIFNKLKTTLSNEDLTDLLNTVCKK